MSEVIHLSDRRYRSRYGYIAQTSGVTGARKPRRDPRLGIAILAAYFACVALLVGWATGLI